MKSFNEIVDNHWLNQITHVKKVCEIKECSPYGWESPYDIDQMLEICSSLGDVISVHTNPLWQHLYNGQTNFQTLRHIRKQTQQQILAKGFHNTLSEIDMAFDCGADYVMTVGWFPYAHKRVNNIWYEPETYTQLADTNAQFYVLNQRDPRTGGIGLVSEQSFLTHPILQSKRKNGKICLASNINKVEDIPKTGIDYILIGEGLYV